MANSKKKTRTESVFPTPQLYIEKFLQLNFLYIQNTSSLVTQAMEIYHEVIACDFKDEPKLKAILKPRLVNLQSHIDWDKFALTLTVRICVTRMVCIYQKSIGDASIFYTRVQSIATNVFVNEFQKLDYSTHNRELYFVDKWITKIQYVQLDYITGKQVVVYDTSGYLEKKRSKGCDFCLYNQNIYDLRGKLVKEAINPKDYDNAFCIQLKDYVPIYNLQDILWFHYENTNDKIRFYKHIKYVIATDSYFGSTHKKLIDEWLKEIEVGVNELKELYKKGREYLGIKDFKEKLNYWDKHFKDTYIGGGFRLPNQDRVYLAPKTKQEVRLYNEWLVTCVKEELFVKKKETWPELLGFPVLDFEELKSCFFEKLKKTPKQDTYIENRLQELEELFNVYDENKEDRRYYIPTFKQAYKDYINVVELDLSKKVLNISTDRLHAKFAIQEYVKFKVYVEKFDLKKYNAEKDQSQNTNRNNKIKDKNKIESFDFNGNVVMLERLYLSFVRHHIVMDRTELTDLRVYKKVCHSKTLT